MTTKARPAPKTNAAKPRYRTIDGKRVVVLEEKEYLRLRQQADDWEPLLPAPDADGNYPALEYLRASLARKIIRHRRRVGLTQVELARRAGIRPETLNRIEQARHSPSVPTLAKIEKALKAAEREG